MSTSPPRWAADPALAVVIAHEALGWLQDVLSGLRRVEGDYARVGGSPGGIDGYVRAKVLTVNDLYGQLERDALEGPGAMVRTLAGFEPGHWIEQDYGTKTFQLVSQRVNRIRGVLISMIMSGAPLPAASEMV